MQCYAERGVSERDTGQGRLFRENDGVRVEELKAVISCSCVFFWTFHPHSLTANWLQADRHSPLDLGAPVPLAIGNGPRPRQTSALALLPQVIQLEIIAQLLSQPGEASGSPTGSDSKSSLAKLLPEDDVNSFIALTQTCAAFRHLEVPSSTWETLILDNVRRWTLSLLNRWRANPSGVGSASQLWIALNEDFEEPVKVALASARERRGYGQPGEGEDGQDGDQKPGYRVRDVWTWWAYNDAWRSRRRVWYCVVHGCATARDADWW